MRSCLPTLQLTLCPSLHSSTNVQVQGKQLCTRSSMAPKYKLTYLNMMGVAEPIRFLLEYSGADWEDVRIKKGPELKAIAPFGKVPILEIDGKKVHQSVAICRYLGKQFKLNGDSDWEALQIDMVIDTVGDIRQAHIQSLSGNKEELARKKAELANVTIPYYLERCEAIVNSNGGHFVNGKLTWADFYWAHMFAMMKTLYDETALKDIASKFPALNALQKKVLELPAIKAWVAKRPKSDH